MFKDERFLPIEEQEPVEEEFDDFLIEDFSKKKKGKETFPKRKNYLYVAS